MRGTTIAAVAAEAGVGVGTVSRVLNGSAAVSEPTRRRVLDAIVALDYQPSSVARALSTGRTHAVGVVAPFFTRPSVIERLRGVSRALAGAGYQLILLDVERPEQRADLFRSLAVKGRIDGLLAVSLAPSAADLRRLEAMPMPVVLVDRAHDRLPAVTIDNVAGGRMAAEHLLELGHERIAFLGDAEDAADDAFGFDSSARRCEGFSTTLAEAGLPLAGDRIVLCPHGRATARAAAAELLAEAERPTAIFASSDVQAIGVLEAAQSLGVRVPDELSVIGFDDVEAAGFTNLTTVAQPLEESGALGAELLLRVLSGEPARGRRLPLAIVRRGSTAPSLVGNGKRAIQSPRGASSQEGGVCT